VRGLGRVSSAKGKRSGVAKEAHFIGDRHGADIRKVPTVSKRVCIQWNHRFPNQNKDFHFRFSFFPF
jgi:hypothetical protein